MQQALGALLRQASIDDSPSGPLPAPELSVAADAATIGDSAELSWPPRVAGAPTGDVTLVFTDIQGFSALWEAAPALMRNALAQHDAVLRATLLEHDGYEVKTQGDAFMIAFANPQAAVAFAIDAQRALLEVDWHEALLTNAAAAEEIDDGGAVRFRGLRVRMGVYAGRPDARPDPNTGRMDYFGTDVNRAARVESAAQGGQVLIGGALAQGSAEQVSARLGGHAVASCGEHRLKGIAEPVPIVELRAGPLARRTFPPLHTADDPSTTNLPDVIPTPLGRDADLATVQEALDARRLVTLLGPGGTGKTTLATWLGRQAHQSGAFAGGVWFADLTEARTVGGVLTTVARTLGVETLGGAHDAMATQIGNALAARGATLLLLDNLEQVVEVAAPVVQGWLAAAPALRMVATSRIPLALTEEQAIELGPLDEAAAVKLFETRAGRAPNEVERADVARLVERLDGMPLAIELAAARAGVLSPAQILQRLDARLDLLQGQARDVSFRQATLRGAIDWSWELLSEEERSVFRQCGAFAGGFCLEAAEVVIASEAPVLDVLEALKTKSLLRTLPDGRGGLRFTLYETLRVYAVEQLAKEPALQREVFARHAAHYVKRGQEWMSEVDGPRPGQALDALSLEQENLIAVMNRFAEEAPALSVLAGLCVDRLGAARAPRDLRMQMLGQLIDRAADAGDERLHAEALLRRARTNAIDGDAADAVDDLEQVIEIAEAAGDTATAFEALSYAARASGRSFFGDEALRYLDRAATLYPSHKRSRAACVYLGTAGMLALRRGDFPTAVEKGRQAARAARRLGDLPLEARYIGNIGIFAGLSGDTAQAGRQYRRAEAIWQDLGNQPMVAMCHGNLGVLATVEGDLDAGTAKLDDALAGHLAAGNRYLWAVDATSRALIDIERGALDEAEALLEPAAEVIEDHTGADRERSNMHMALALLALARGDVAEALRRMEQGRTFYQSLERPDVLEAVDRMVALAEAIADATRSHEEVREAAAGFDAAHASGFHLFAVYRRILSSLAARRLQGEGPS